MRPGSLRLLVGLTLLLALMPVAARAADARPEILGLGDSVMSGRNCDCDGIPTMYARRVTWRDGVSVHPVNLGVAGATTASLQADLNTSSYSAAVSRARVVLLDIGANDLYPALAKWEHGGCDSACYAPMVRGMKHGLDQDLRRINSLRPGHSEVMVATYWNVFEDGKQTERAMGWKYIAWSRKVTRAANYAICSIAQAEHNKCVPLYPPFILQTHGDPTPYLAADGDHPNYRGSLVITRHFLSATRWRLFE